MGSSPIRIARKSSFARGGAGKTCAGYASVAQLVEQRTENPRVVGSIPTGGTRKRGSGAPAEEGRAARGRKTECGFSSFGRARPCQGRGSGFEPRNPLQRGGPAPTSAHWRGSSFSLGRKRLSPSFYADVAQVVAHILGKDEVTSSNLVISSKYGAIAKR